ncbi:TRAUB-domain-containing protein [Phlebopus sp. FC_14]|nr:TRAUB-domain-containing protein [Phlebopus sp. FC_14]
MERLSLALQIAQLEDVAPADFDPEDIQVTGVDPDGIVTDDGAARAHYIDVGPSALRKRHDSVVDPKYDGVKTSRKELMDEHIESSDEDADDDVWSSHDEGGVDEPQWHSQDEVDHESSPFDEENQFQQDAHIHAIDEPIERPESLDQCNDLSSALRKTREEDRKKGKAVSKQIVLWDLLLDARIRVQKSVNTGNRLPQLSQYAGFHEVQASLTKMLAEAQALSDELFDLQENLLSFNETVLIPPRKRRRVDDHERSIAEYSDELREASGAASSLENIYHPHLIHTLNKWSSKIQAVSPSVLLPSNRNTFSRSTQHLKSAAQLIDETLADHSRLLARSRIYRGKGERLNSKTLEDAEQKEEVAEVFDDTDFYHQLLRDVIDSRSNGPGGNDDWMAIQRQKKAKKKVDTKASKGRKLRFEVHEKIQNFMVPVPAQGSWHEEQIDELFASLLGKGFETAMQEVGEIANEEVDASLQEQVKASLKEGFKVFG